MASISSIPPGLEEGYRYIAACFSKEPDMVRRVQTLYAQINDSTLPGDTRLEILDETIDEYLARGPTSASHFVALWGKVEGMVGAGGGGASHVLAGAARLAGRIAAATDVVTTSHEKLGYAFSAVRLTNEVRQKRVAHS